MVDSSKPKCTFSKPDGSTCKASCLPASAFCYFHDPDRAGERDEARRKGGKRRAQQAKPAAILPMTTAEQVKLANVSDVLALLSQTASDVRSGAVDPKTANCLAYIASVGLRAIQDGEVEERLSRLEALAAAQGKRAHA